MKAYVFPGQGSQAKGMGGELFDAYRDLVSKADAILGFSIKELCLNDQEGKLTQTQFTQPALFTVHALSFIRKKEETGSVPDFVAGHSIGEFSALFAAEVFDFETGLKIVRFRSQLMSEAKGGGMAAVIGLDSETVQKVLQDNNLYTIDVANYNSFKQIVISGMKADIDAAKSIFEKAGAMMYIPLNVSGAFHSRYMNDAGIKFKSFVEQFEFSQPKIPVIANINARPYEKGIVKENLSKQITDSVQWVASVQYMMNNGVSEFLEIGPGKVLTGLIQKIQKNN
jgi:trans-AT polyketide synthase/acyltransferase/oxidoreductase domain-containing protein